MLGFGSEEDTFQLSTEERKIVNPSRTLPGSRQPEGGGRQGQGSGGQGPAQKLTSEQKRQRAQTACGGAPCPEGLGQRVLFRSANPVRLAEFEAGMTGRGCALLCSVGDELTYCCPAAQQAQNVVTDPFATDPMELDADVLLPTALAPTAVPGAAPSNGENGEPSGLVVLFGVLGLGVVGFIGFAALRRKSKKRKSKKEKS